MIVYGRDGRLGPRLKHMFQGTFRNPEANKLIGVYEISLRRNAEGSPGKLHPTFCASFRQLCHIPYS
jgi:kinesin family protein 1